VLVKAPDGRRWRVRRVWMGWRKVEDPLGHLPRDPIRSLSYRSTTVGTAAALSALIQVAAFPLVVAWKLALRRPVKIEAVPLDNPPEAHSWHVVGYGAGRRAIQTLCDRIRSGAEPALPE
jgi:hypothetical protein